MPNHSYLSLASAMHRLTEPAIRAAISSFLFDPLHHGGSHGLDAACGNGDHSLWLAQALSPHGRVTGLDICREGLLQARASSEIAGLPDRLAYVQGDVRSLPFEDHAFDWVWCADALWPGLPSEGFLGLDLMPVLQEMMRVVRPGGLISILFWSSQKLLPGHPFLEARLNATRAACYPFRESWSSSCHILSAPVWLGRLGLVNVWGRTFAADNLTSISGQSRDDLADCFQMLWGRALPELSDEDRIQFERLCLKESADFIVDRPGYYGFITCTLFTGQVPSSRKRSFQI